MLSTLAGVIRRLGACAVATLAFVLSAAGSTPAHALGTRLRAGATVSVPSGIDATGSRDVTIEGHGSTLFATTDGSGGPPPFYNYRAHWPRLREHVEIRDSQRVTVRDLTVEGPNRDGTFRAELEGQAGFVVTRSSGVTLDGITARATYGDGVYIVGGSVDVTIRRCGLDHNGGQGVADGRPAHPFLDPSSRDRRRRFPAQG